MRDYFARHHPPHIGFSAWIADHRRAAADENNRHMSGALHVRHCHQLDKVPYVQAVRSRVEHNVKFYAFLAKHFFETLMCGLLQKASFL